MFSLYKLSYRYNYNKYINILLLKKKKKIYKIFDIPVKYNSE
jgi:hypothetical protein